MAEVNDLKVGDKIRLELTVTEVRNRWHRNMVPVRVDWEPEFQKGWLGEADIRRAEVVEPAEQPSS